MEKAQYSEADLHEVPSYLDNDRKAVAGLTPDFVPPTPEEEAKVIRKLDLRLMPYVMLLYTLAVLDRSNLGNARLAGLEKAINLKGNHYQLLGTIFYIAYILSQWLLVGWKVFPPHVYCSIAVLGWGIVATVQASVHSWGSLMACRAFLGVFEAAFGPGVPLYLSFFYPRAKIGFRNGLFIAGAALANCYGGALAYGLTKAHTKLPAWKLLFIVEGAPTIALAFVTFFWLPDNIWKTRFLSEREKQIASYMVSQNQQADPDSKGGFKIKELGAAFLDPKSFIPALMYFGYNVSFASLPLFVPTIISQIGHFTQIQANGLSAPPYAVAFITILLITWLSDRFQMRGPFVVLCSWTAAIGFILQATTTGTVSRYVGVFLTIQIFVCVPLTLAWVANMHSTESKKAGGNMILATIGQCGPVLGTNLFPNSEKPYFRKGMWVSAAMCIFVGCLAILLSTYLIFENRKMERAGTIAKKGENRRESVQHGIAQSEKAEVPKYRYIW